MRNTAQYCGETPVVVIQVAEKDDRVFIRVSDNGPGIPESIRSSLFQRGTSTNGGGLGLYLTREILRACKGDIQLEESRKNEGAVFMIELPLDKDPPPG
jgi:signal transduction histidine kinase